MFLVCLLISLTYAYYKTRYAEKIYPVTTSIYFKENKQSNGEGRLLYNNPLVNVSRNYKDEIFIIKSYPLIERTLKELNFGVGFYNEGNIKTTEIYDPQVKIIVLQHAYYHQFYFKILNQQEFQLFERKENSTFKNFAFGDTINFSGLKFIASLKSNAHSYIPNGQPTLFTYNDPSNLTGSYIGGLQTQWAEEGAGVLIMTINGSIPQKQIDFLNGLIRVYQSYDLERKNQTASRTIDFIDEQLRAIRDSLSRAEDKLQRVKSESLYTGMNTETAGLFGDRLNGMEDEKSQLFLKDRYYKYLKEYISQEESFDKIILPSSVGISDPILVSLVSKWIEGQALLKDYSIIENPLVADEKRKIEYLKGGILESVRNLEQADKIKMDFMNQRMQSMEQKMSGLPLAERKLVAIKRNYSFLESLYIFLLEKSEEAGISRASSTTDIATLNPPMQAGGAINPNPTKNYAFAVALGLGLPTLLFVLLELLNSKIQSKEDVEKVTTIPFIGGIGHMVGENNLEVFSSPKNAISESFRALRSDLNYFLGKREKAVIVITSSISGEGKTFTSINLASVFSISDKKTLLIGADMRRPKIFDDFSLSNEIGLSTYLAGIAEFDAVIQHTPYKRLDLVSGGPIPPNPSELLLTSRLKGLIHEAKSRYDFIIIDTPPLAIVSDAFAFEEFADHTLFVIRQNYTPVSLLRSIDDSYRTGKLKNTSIILNDIYISGPGYGYGYGYGYLNNKSKSRNGYGYYS